MSFSTDLSQTGSTQDSPFQPRPTKTESTGTRASNKYSENLLDGYFDRLQNHSPLSAEKQTELARKYREDGDQAAAQRLISTNLRLVVKMAREHNRRDVELQDLIHAGNLGLVEALEKFDPEKGIQFISYAQYWVRAKMMDYLKHSAHPVKMYTSRAGRKLFYNLEKTKKKLQKEGIEPTPKRIAEELDVSEKDVREIGANIDNSPTSLDSTVVDDGTTTYGELLVDSTQNPEQTASRWDLTEKIRKFVIEYGNELSDARKQDIWFLRTSSETPATLKVLGQKWGVTKERIRQIEKQLLKDARKAVVKTFGEDFSEVTFQSNGKNRETRFQVYRQSL